MSASLSGDMSLVNYAPSSTYGAAARPPIPVVLFYALVLANGNFVAPGAFVYDKYGGGRPTERMPAAIMKLSAVGISIAVLLARVKSSRIPIVVGSLAYLTYIRVVYGDTFTKLFKAGVNDAATPAVAVNLATGGLESKL